ncbi:hypothetical protein ANAPH2_00636 [Anaplasma phagocytophilum]|nr:hypothetical protein ANAPH2_00636 [Anaplasma phagocytophilum]
MLLLGRLITLLLLLPRPLVKTSFSLLRRLGFLILILIARFVGRRMEGVARISMVSTPRKLRRQRAPAIILLYVEGKAFIVVIRTVQSLRF